MEAVKIALRFNEVKMTARIVHQMFVALYKNLILMDHVKHVHPIRNLLEKDVLILNVIRLNRLWLMMDLVKIVKSQTCQMMKVQNVFLENVMKHWRYGKMIYANFVQHGKQLMIVMQNVLMLCAIKTLKYWTTKEYVKIAQITSTLIQMMEEHVNKMIVDQIM